MNALGMVEVCGFTTAICCADIAAKAADVKIIALDKNKPLNGDNAEVPLIMNVKIEGSVAAVEEAVNAAKAHAMSKNLFVTSHVIPRPEIDTEKLAFLSDVGRDRWVDSNKANLKVDVKKAEDKKAESQDEKQMSMADISEIKPEEETTKKAETVTQTEKKPRGRRPKSSK